MFIITKKETLFKKLKEGMNIETKDGLVRIDKLDEKKYRFYGKTRSQNEKWYTIDDIKI